MAAKETRKEKKAQRQRENRKYRSRKEQERRQRRIINGLLIGVVALVVILLGYGWLNDNYLKQRKAVAVVNGEKITLGEFQARVRMQRQQEINRYQQYLLYAQVLGIDPQTDPNFSPLIRELETRLAVQPLLIGQDVLEQMINEILIRQAAAEMGITVSPEEVEQAIYETFSYYPDGTPTPAPTNTPVTYPTLSPTQLALVTPTFTPGPTNTPPPTATPDAEATATLQPIPTPTATPYTLEGFQQEYENTLKIYEPLGIDEATFRELFEFTALRNKVYEVITADVPAEEEQVWARHILVADEETAKEIRQRLLDGEDFGALAQEFSQDPGSAMQGGDLGWFGRGRMVAPFEEAAFALEIGEISEPVESQFGWHIIQVLGREIRPLTAEEYAQAKDRAFAEWVQSLQEKAEIERYPEVWQNNTPTDPALQ